MNEIPSGETSDSAFKSLYKLGSAASFMVAVLTLSEIIFFALYPQPGAVSDWFDLFQSNKLIGILDFWGLEIPMYLLFLLVFLALYVALRKADKGLMAIAIILVILGIAIFLATNNPFSMLSLSNQYTAATTDVDRSTFLAAGQAILTNTNQRAVGGFNLSLFLVSVAGLITSSVMLQSHSFSRFTAYVGILAYALSLADYLRQALTSSPIVALLVILPGALLLMLWFVLVGRSLYQLGRTHTVDSH
jgi:hypothetical protein